jgi:hypothetical protein
VAVSRFASLLDGMYRDWLDDPGFRQIVERDLADGQRREQILFAARAVETEPSLIGFSGHLIAAAARP